MAMIEEAPLVQYFDSDFDAAEWIEECQGKPLPPITSEENMDEASQWDAFFHTHIGGQFFKARKYIYPAYQKWLDKSKVCLEVGCGHGCSIFPLLGHPQIPDMRVIATDYSSEALTSYVGRVAPVLWHRCHAHFRQMKPRDQERIFFSGVS